MNLLELDNIYTNYGFEIKEHSGIRVYTYTKGIYPGADIVKIDASKNIELVKSEYHDQGFAIKVKEYNTLLEAEESLFHDFFQSHEVIQNLKRKYNTFIEKIMNNLPDEASYEYIQSDYEYTLFKDNALETVTSSIDHRDLTNSIVNNAVKAIQETKGPLLIIIEAAAGYGKTCTTFEILKNLLEQNNTKKVPFFTELSRDRQATIFKHILQNEIEEQFSNRVDSKVVTKEIKSGRIPLLIDGFDELISKDFSFKSNDFQQVENMLSTVVDLLSGEAKILITSRKTAIFNSEEFIEWMNNKNIHYSLLRIIIAEPSIENWLPQNKIEKIQEYSKIPVANIANPLLLNYLKYLPESTFDEKIKGSIVDDYFEYILRREQERQNLTLEPAIQLRIFRKLARLFIEFDIKSAIKEDIKNLVLEYNKNILDDSLKKYPASSRPKIEQLADTLSNHVLLDRKDNKTVGFLNEFILGTLIGQNYVLNKFNEHKKIEYNQINQAYSLLAVEAFRAQPKEIQNNLWKIFTLNDFKYDIEFYFKIDFLYEKSSKRLYKDANIVNYKINNVNFEDYGSFSHTVFSNCEFTNCTFNISNFDKVSFVDCMFYQCSTIPYSFTNNNNIEIYGCESDNQFVTHIYNSYSNFEIIDDYDTNLEEECSIEILSLFFKPDGINTNSRQMRTIASRIDGYDTKLISKCIQDLKSNGYLHIYNELGYLTKDGIKYYQNNVNNSK